MLSSENSVKASAIVICVTGILLASHLQAQMIRFWTFTSQDVIRLLTPLILTSLFIERALEVLVTPWRGGDADELKRQVGFAKDSKPDDVGILRQELLRHRSETRQITFLAGLALGTIISALGLRAMEPFFEPSAFNTLPSMQQTLLTGTDVLISGTLLAGGADGLHKLVNIFTNFFEATATKAKVNA